MSEPGPNPFAVLESPGDPLARAGHEAIPDATLRLATPARRFWARILDRVLLLLPVVVVSAVGTFVEYGAAMRAQDAGALPGRSDTLLALAGLAMMFVFVLQAVLITMRGQSLAKMALGIRIVDRNGGRVGFVRAVLVREWLFSIAEFFPLFGPLLSLVDGLSIFTTDIRTLHDRAAGTQVVRL